MEYTEEQKKDVQERIEKAHAEISEVLKKYELNLQATPAFMHVQGGSLVTTQLGYGDLKYSKKPVIETEESKEDATA